MVFWVVREHSGCTVMGMFFDSFQTLGTNDVLYVPYGSLQSLLRRTTSPAATQLWEACQLRRIASTWALRKSKQS